MNAQILPDVTDDAGDADDAVILADTAQLGMSKSDMHGIAAGADALTGKAQKSGFWGKLKGANPGGRFGKFLNMLFTICPAIASIGQAVGIHDCDTKAEVVTARIVVDAR
jgi:hypothetical protein